jgi:hypothetical protein
MIFILIFQGWVTEKYEKPRIDVNEPELISVFGFQFLVDTYSQQYAASVQVNVFDHSDISGKQTSLFE